MQVAHVPVFLPTEIGRNDLVIFAGYELETRCLRPRDLATWISLSAETAGDPCCRLQNACIEKLDPTIVLSTSRNQKE